MRGETAGGHEQVDVRRRAFSFAQRAVYQRCATAPARDRPSFCLTHVKRTHVGARLLASHHHTSSLSTSAVAVRSFLI